MAVFRSSFLHELKKSVAENTYYRSRGQNIMRFKIATNHSKTPKQQQQRAWLKRCVELCDLFSLFLSVSLYSLSCLSLSLCFSVSLCLSLCLCVLSLSP